MRLLLEVLPDAHDAPPPLSIDYEHNDTRRFVLIDLPSVVESEDLSSDERRCDDAVVLGTELSDA